MPTEVEEEVCLAVLHKNQVAFYSLVAKVKEFDATPFSFLLCVSIIPRPETLAAILMHKKL